MRKIFILLGYALLWTGCESAVRPTVSGFDAEQNPISCQGLMPDEACFSNYNTEFSDNCLAAGYDIIYCENCEMICTQPVS